MSFRLFSNRRRRDVVVRSVIGTETLERRTLLAAFVVTDAGDSGPGTLRQAILDANANDGPFAAVADTITFDLPGGGAVRTIRPLSALPEITGQTTLDAATQPGVAVELDGSAAGAGANGLTVSGRASIVRGLVINRFSGHGVALVKPAVVLSSRTDIRLEGNRIGTDAAGAVALSNGGAGVMITAAGVTIGPAGGERASALTRNVISGNALAGVWVPPGLDARFIGPAVRGNYIGTNAAGDRALGNGGDGVLLESGFDGSVGDSFGPNLISGNTGSGVRVAPGRDVGGGIIVEFNYIGTDAGGNAALGNGADGVTDGDGGDTIRANVISGNRANGVLLRGPRKSILNGNFVGTNAAGNAGLGNGRDGIAIVGARFGASLVGTNSLAAPITLSPSGGNLVSANGRHGISISNSETDVSSLTFLYRNFIGTDASGRAPLGNAGSGVFVASGIPNLSQSIRQNIISANGGDGVTVAGTGETGDRAVKSVQILENRIGVGATAVESADVALGNAGNGVAILGASGNTTSGNVIAFNGGAGVLVAGRVMAEGAALAAGDSNPIFTNSIYSNVGLGIDLSNLAGTGDGVTPNDPGDADAGANGLQNYPRVTSALSGVSGSKIAYSLDSEPNQDYLLEFFSNAAPDASGRGEGQTFLASARAHTDAAGHAEGAAEPPLATAGLYVTATATLSPLVAPDLYAVKSTSEFSPAVLAVQGPTTASVAGRHVFYNNSAFDGGADGPADDAAVAPDKHALLPGETASAANVTGYTKGINGVMIDVRGLPAGADLSANDFQTSVPDLQPVSVTLRRGAGDGGSDRITLYFPDFSAPPTSVPTGVANGWLGVTIKANPDTGLARPDTFYFGNLIGETGDALTPTRVSAADLGGLKAHLNQQATVASPYDINHDGRVNALDLGIAKKYLNQTLAPVVPSQPVPAPPPAASADESIVRRAWDEPHAAVL